MSLLSRTLNALAYVGKLYAEGFAAVGASMGNWGDALQPRSYDDPGLPQGYTGPGGYQPPLPAAQAMAQDWQQVGDAMRQPLGKSHTP